MPRNLFFGLAVLASTGPWLLEQSFGVNTPQTTNYLSLMLFCALATLRPSWALAAFAALLPIWGGASFQAKALWGVSIPLSPLPEFDAGLGLAFGVAFSGLFNSAGSAAAEPLPAGPGINGRAASLICWSGSLLLLWMSLSGAVAISRNLVQGLASFDPVKIPEILGFFRDYSFFDDFFPLRSLTVWFTVVALAMILIRVRNPLLTSERVCCLIPSAIAGGAILLHTYALVSKTFEIGYARSGVGRGVNSFFPDLHSYSGYALLTFFGAVGFLISSSSPTNDPSIQFNTLWARKRSTFVAIVVVLLSFGGLLASSSRTSILLCFIGILMTLIVRFRKNPKALALAALTTAAAAGSAILILKKWHFGGRSLQAFWETLVQVVEHPLSESSNLLLSYRPEVISEAIRMGMLYPIGGLGHSTLYRNASLPGFSHSNYFLKSGGENAHNFFAQMFAETGLVGLTLFLCLLGGVFFLPGKGRLLFAYKTAFFGLLLGNLFAHSLLVESIQFLFGLTIVGAIFASEPTSSPQKWETSASLGAVRFVRDRISRGHQIVIAVTLFCTAALFWGSEIGRSFVEPPVTNKRLCWSPRIYSDGQTSGEFEIPLKLGKAPPVIHFTHHHDDVSAENPVVLNVVVREKNGQYVFHQELIFTTKQDQILPTPMPESGEGKLFGHVNHCFVPQHFGRGGDRRRLGMRIVNIRDFR